MPRRRKERIPARTILLFAASVFFFAACASDAPLDSLDPAGPAAERILELFNPVFWIAVGIFVLVQGLLLAAVVLFREKEGRPLPRQVHGNTLLEIIWTVIPALILTGVGVVTVQAIFELREREPDALEVEVIGHQWWWEYRYPELGVVTANELHIPVDRQVWLTMTSDDVIHSFWVPRLAGKQDVVPGRETQLALRASSPGVYWGQCAEFCGLSHALMHLRVVAESEEEFMAWAEDQRRPAEGEPATEEELAHRGWELFVNGQCVSCHVVAGVNDDSLRNPVGPDLTHFASRDTFAGSILENNPENLARWLRNPPEVKPGSKMPDLNLGPEEIRSLVAYLGTLR